MEVRLVGGPLDGTKIAIEEHRTPGTPYALNGDLYVLTRNGLLGLQFRNPASYGLGELAAAIILEPVAPPAPPETSDEVL